MIFVPFSNKENDMENRNNYLVKSSLNKYLLASIITMAVMNLNGMIDGVLMGRFLGPDALSAIQNSMPVISGIAAVNQLLTGGAAVIVSKALGKRDFSESNRSLTASFITNLAAGVLIAVFSPFLAEKITSLLCVDQGLYENTHKYVQVLLMGSPLLIFQNGMSVTVDVMGGPKTVTKSMIASVIANLVCDVVIVKGFSTDIKGAAAATLIGALFSIVVFIGFFIKKKEELRLKADLSGFGGILGENLKKGIPGLVSTIATTILTLMCNYFVQTALGKDGMFVVSIGFNLISFGNMIGSGIGMAFLGIGGMLVGQKDYTGLRMLVKRGMTISMSAAVFFNILSWLIPDKLAMIFGAKSDVLINMTRSALPIVALYIFAMDLIAPMSIIYQINEHNGLATASSLSLIISLALGFVAHKLLLSPEQIWYAFPIGTVLAVIFVVAATVMARKSAKKQTDFFTLIPTQALDVSKLELSVECTKNGIRESLRKVMDFLSDYTTEVYFDQMIHAIEEVLLNYLTNSGRSENQFMDMDIAVDKEGISVIIKDDGIPFDPLHVEDEKKEHWLKIFLSNASNADYSYSFGENIILMRWLNSEMNGTAEEPSPEPEAP